MWFLCFLVLFVDGNELGVYLDIEIVEKLLRKILKFSFFGLLRRWRWGYRGSEKFSELFKIIGKLGVELE